MTNRPIFLVILLCMTFVLLCQQVIIAQNNTFEKSERWRSISIISFFPVVNPPIAPPNAFPKVQSFYSNIQIETDFTRYENEKNEKKAEFSTPRVGELPLAGCSHVTFYASSKEDVLHSFYRFDVADYQKQSTSGQPVEELIGIVTPTSSYLINKLGEQGYALAGQEKTTEESVAQHVLSVPFHSAPYALSGIPVDRWCFVFDNSTVQSVVLNSTPEGEIVVVKFKRSYPKGDALYECHFIRNKGWALKYAKKTVGSGDDIVGGFVIQNEYEGERNHVPLLKYVTYEEYEGTKDKTQIYRRKEYNITKIIPSAPEMSYFDINQFVPAIGEPVRWSYLRLFCVASGLVLILIAIWIKFSATKKFKHEKIA